jgi:hypothetical protein
MEFSSGNMRIIYWGTYKNIIHTYGVLIETQTYINNQLLHWTYKLADTNRPIGPVLDCMIRKLLYYCNKGLALRDDWINECSHCEWFHVTQTSERDMVRILMNIT